MSDASRPRTELIGDAALRVLARRGARGLTHRAVDAAAGLPTGSTSYYARTRTALLALALDRAAARETALLGLDPAGVTELDLSGGLDGLADLTARLLHRTLSSDHELLRARYELALEATRDPDLRRRYDRLGGGIRNTGGELLAALGSTDPPRHTRLLTAWAEGVLFGAAAGADPVPGLDELRASARELLRSVLGETPSEPAGRGRSAPGQTSMRDRSRS